jgi:hypothetical protein
MTRNDDLRDRDDRLAQYLSGGLGPAERRAVDETILSDDAMADATYAALNLEAAFDEAGRARSRQAAPARVQLPWWRALGWRTLLPLGAAVAAMVLLVPRIGITPGDAPTYRGDDAPVIELLEPLPDGEVIGPTVFRWALVPGASYYRFELLDERGRLVTEEVVTTPTIDLTPTTPQPTLTRGFWRVTAVDAGGRDLVASPLTRFGPTP